MAADLFWRRLGEMVGEEHLSFDAGRLLDGRWDDPLPNAIVRPANRKQAREVVLLAHSGRRTVAPAGGCSKQRFGGVPRRIDFLLSLDRLNRITDYQAADLTVTVEAGVRMADLAATLQGQGQMLPLDPPFGAEATVGGVLATNGSGPRRLAYGTARDMILGVHFIAPVGKLAKSGGKVVKNVAGYDLAKVLIGSLGTLGVLTDVTFKVFPIPPASATLVLGFPDAAQSLHDAHRILNSPYAPQALDLLDRAAASLMEEPGLSEFPFVVVVSAAGPEPVVERISRDLPALLQSESPMGKSPMAKSLTEVARLSGEAESKLWRKIQEITPSFLRAHPDGVVVKASVLLTQMVEVIEAARRAASDHGLGSAVVARAGTGIVYCYLWPEEAAEPPSPAERLGSACKFLLQETERLGGRAIVEWAPVAVQNRVYIWGTLPDDFPLMQRLKGRMDPRGILNPGRFYGGL